MKKYFNFNVIFADNTVRISFLLSIMIFLAGLVSILFFYRFLPPLVPVFNQLPWGDIRVGPRYMLLIPYLVILCAYIINLYVAKFLYNKMPLVARIIGLTTFFISILVIVFTVRTILLVI